MKNFLLCTLCLSLSFYLTAQTKGLYVNNSNGTVSPPSNEKRYALVIGNNSYATNPLKNPINDANEMAAALQSLGFEVTTVTDASRTAMTRAIQQLGQKARGQNAVALFYYSGHGLQVNNDNFLVPIDASVQSEPDVEVACISLNYLMRQLEQANSGTNIIVLDACRNNPFSYNRTTGGGLATPSRTPSGTYIAFATAPLTTAADGTGRNSPYTTALVKAIKEPNIKIEDAFKMVRREVKRMGQTPWENSSMDGDFYFNPSSNGGVTPAPQPTPQYQPPVITPSVPEKLDFTETATGVSFTMKYITGNSFQMGSIDSDAADDEKIIHTVRLSAFYISKYEVTFSEYDKFCDATSREKPKDEGWGRGTRPVINVSWDDAVAYCNWLSRTTGKTYRLPTEAEWEYSARGGESYKYAGSSTLDNVAWYTGNSSSQTHPVGGKQPNGFGLYDMIGNVSEWCSDWYGAYSSSSQQNPTGAPTGSDRVTRGGDWDTNGRNCRSTLRDITTPSVRDRDIGFRVCSSLQ